jgi:hypothetical protein
MYKIRFGRKQGFREEGYNMHEKPPILYPPRTAPPVWLQLSLRKATAEDPSQED